MVLDLFKYVTTDPMTALVYQSNLWKLLEKVNVSVTLALVPFHIGMVQKALKGT